MSSLRIDVVGSIFAAVQHHQEHSGIISRIEVSRALKDLLVAHLRPENPESNELLEMRLFGFPLVVDPGLRTLEFRTSITYVIPTNVW